MSVIQEKTVAVAGTVCLDEIRHPGKPPVNGFGGLFYPIITLAQLLGDRDRIIPLCRIGEADYDGIIAQFDSYRSIDLNHIKAVPGRNNSVILDYISDFERQEYSINIPPPILIDDLIPVLDSDILLINFISGREMLHRTFKGLRKRAKIPVYVDLHSIFLGLGERGRRYYWHRDWSSWHKSGDYVQMNKQEASMLAGSDMTDNGNLRDFCYFLLDKGATAVNITMGYDGCFTAWRDDSGINSKVIPAFSVGDTVDPTGCGDVFGASYVYSLLQGADPLEAAEFGVKVSGVRAVQRHSSDLHNLGEKLRTLNIL